LVKKSVKLTEKDLKIEEDHYATNEDSNKLNVNYSTAKTKSKKEVAGVITPKIGIKSLTGDKQNTNKQVNPFNQKKDTIGKTKYNQKESNKLSASNTNYQSSNQIKTTNSTIDIKDHNKLTNNPQFSICVNNLDNIIINNRKESMSYVVSKLHSLESSEFFSNLFKLKNMMNTFMNYKEEEFVECSEVMLRYIETLTNSLNSRLNEINSKSPVNDDPNDFQMLSSEIEHINLDGHSFTEENLKNNFSDDELINYIHSKSNSVAFEIPVRRARAMSDNDQKLKKKKNSSLHEKFLNKARLSSEEIEKRMKDKMTTAERNKNYKKSQYFENVNRIMSKINEIKQKKKMEKQENLKKISVKLEAYNLRHLQFLNEKTQKAKHEQQKVREINFIHRMEKENRDLSIIKKFNISIERREQYIRKKMNKALERKLKGEAVQEAVKQKNILNEQLRNKVLEKFQKYSSKKEEEKLLSVDDKLDVASKRKIRIEDQIEFLKSVYSENFVWDLVEADYFDVEDLYNLSNITKFEIVKAKLKKDKEKIEKLLDRENKSKLSSKNRTDTTYSNSNDEFAKIFVDNDEDFLFETESNLASPKMKRSKSFTIFNEDDFLEIDYLFKDNQTKKRKRKKKKKPEFMKKRLIKTINSMSQHDFTSFFHQMNIDKKMKKYLIKNKQGKYVKSKIIIQNEEIEPKRIEFQNNKNETIKTIKSIDFNSEPTEDKLNNFPYYLTNSEEGETVHKESAISHQMTDDKKEKLIKSFLQSSDMNRADGNSANTLLINSESLSNILEKNAITVKWCKLCNMIVRMIIKILVT